MKTVIGLAGVKTSGKTTVSDIIMELISNSKESALADKLKNVSAEAFGLSRDSFDLQSLKEVPFNSGPKFFNSNSIKSILDGFGIECDKTLLNKITKSLVNTPLETPRRIAQIVGTELLRVYGTPDIHCEQVSLYDDITIISDIRFTNEFEYFNKLENIKFIPLYIHRQGAEKVVDLKTSHASETSVFEFNHKCKMINNNGTIDSTKEQIIKSLQGLV